jgi:hypothetical protein
MRRCLEAQPFFEQAVDLFLKTQLNGEAGRTMVGEMDNLSFLSRFEEAHTLRRGLARRWKKRMMTVTSQRSKSLSAIFITG